jgi:hypothetical protein
VSRFAPALALALLFAATACMGDDARLVTLTGDGCVYEGPGSVDAGTISLDIENESDEVGVFELVRIDPGSTPEKLESFIAEEQQRIDGGQRRRTPEFVSVVVPPLAVDPGEASVVNAGLTAGDHAVICSTGTPATTIHATESFEVT